MKNKDKNINKIRIVFWLHFLFAFTSHVVTPIMVGGIIKIVVGWQLDFWISGLILGAAFFSLTYIINHITNDSSFCLLTDLENCYRREIGLEPVGPFLPRFYRKCAEIVRLR